MPEAGVKYTFSGMAVYRSAFFAGLSGWRCAVETLAVGAMASGALRGELPGSWEDVGTPARLDALNRRALSTIWTTVAIPKGTPDTCHRPAGPQRREISYASRVYRDQGRRQSQSAAAPVSPRKPPWLRAPWARGAQLHGGEAIVREHRLSTVCEEAKCPNIGECWNAGTATIMLMGAVCTRACRFCAVDTGNPRGWLDAEEPENVARSVELMGLKYVVLTSVNRDDLPDGGAAHYAAAIRAIKRAQSRHRGRGADAGFPGRACAMCTRCVDSGLDVFAQNVETVRAPDSSGSRSARRLRADHRVLRAAKAHRPEVLTKTSLMLGLGETDAEIRRDPRRICGPPRSIILTLGQYLRPTPNHLTWSAS